VEVKMAVVLGFPLVGSIREEMVAHHQVAADNPFCDLGAVKKSAKSAREKYRNMKNLRMSSIGGTKNDIRVLVDGVIGPLVGAGGYELDVADFGQQLRGMRQVCEKYSDALVVFLGERLRRRPHGMAPSSPSDLESRVSSLKLGDPLIVSWNREIDEKHVFAETVEG